MQTMTDDKTTMRRCAALAWWDGATDNERAEAMLEFSEAHWGQPRGRLGGPPSAAFRDFIAARIIGQRGIAALRELAAIGRARP